MTEVNGKATGWDRPLRQWESGRRACPGKKKPDPLPLIP